MSTGQAALVALAGGAGALARAFVDAAVPARGFPRGILVVNLTGALLLGLLVGLHPDGAILRIAGTGFLGGYTTFSTWILDSLRLERRAAILNIVVTVLMGVTAVLAGRALG